MLRESCGDFFVNKKTPIIGIINMEDNINGSMFHLYESLQYLEDIGYVVYICILNNEYYRFDLRYTKILKELDITSIPYSKYDVFLYNINLIDLFDFKKIHHIYILHTDGLPYTFDMWKKKNIKLIPKATLLINNLPILINDIPYFQIMKKTYFGFGIYDKYFINKKIKSNNRYLIYTKNYNKLFKKISCSKEDIIQQAIKYCETKKYKYVFENENISYNIWNDYDGLIYTRHIDYSPRLPFEFGIMNKPTIFFDISDGIKRLSTISNIELGQEYIMKMTMKLGFEK